MRAARSARAKIRADVDKAYKRAFPKTEAIANKTCPVTGAPITAASPSIVLQGRRFRVATEDCVAKARESSQIVLTRLTRPDVDDVGNTVCPVTGGAVGGNAFCLIGSDADPSFVVKGRRRGQEGSEGGAREGARLEPHDPAPRRRFTRKSISRRRPNACTRPCLNAKLFSAFSGARARIDRTVGGAFSLFDDHIVGKNVELVPNQRIVQAWRAANWPDGASSTATFVLEARGSGTRLVFDHTGFPEGLRDHLAEGWENHYWEPLKKYRRVGAPHP